MRKEVLCQRHQWAAAMCIGKHPEYRRLVDEGDRRSGLLILAPVGLDTDSVGDHEFKVLQAFQFEERAAYYVSLEFLNRSHAIGIHGSHDTKLYVLGSSGFSVGSRVEIEASTVEEDR